VALYLSQDRSLFLSPLCALLIIEDLLYVAVKLVDVHPIYAVLQFGVIPFLSNSDRVCSDCGRLVGGALFEKSRRLRCPDCDFEFGYDDPVVSRVLSNGSSHAWVGVEEDPGGSKQLMFRGMPFSGPLVNYNFGLAAGLFAMLNRSTYPSFVSAAGKAVEAWASQDETSKAQTLALMADEMAFVIEEMIEGRDPCGIQSVR